jgi:hypothetical protein
MITPEIPALNQISGFNLTSQISRSQLSDLQISDFKFEIRLSGTLVL